MTFPFNYLNKADGIWSCQQPQWLMNVFSFLPALHSLRVQLLSFSTLRASGGCVPLNISWATRLVEREVMWRVKMEWLREKKEERGDSRWWWTRAELWKDHDDRNGLCPASPIFPTTRTEGFCLKQLDPHKSLGTLLTASPNLHVQLFYDMWSYKIAHAHISISVLQNVW